MAKTKVSVTIDDSVLRQVDRVPRDTSRSEIIERALRQWLAERSRRRLEEEIAAYYAARSEESRREDEEWAQASARQLGKTWR